MTTARHPELFQLFAGYFHEDWADDGGSPDEVVATYIGQNAARIDLAALADLIDAFVVGAPDDPALERALFEELGCYYVPSADGLSARSWLWHVAARLRAADLAKANVDHAKT